MTTGTAGAGRQEDHVSVTHSCLQLGEIVEAVADPRAGAISTFSGTTRDNHYGKKVVRLEYEGYVPMAELELKKICAQVRDRWNVLKIALVHRLGVTEVGEASVIIAVSSVHRKDSLEAVEFAINTLKATVPIWKLEVYEGDSRVWKENAEWGPGGGCCRKMVPVEGEGGHDQQQVEGGDREHNNDHDHHDEVASSTISRTYSSSSSTNGSGSGSGCCSGAHA
ncbi:unnamed protein product [Ectocarpus sp. CCAP 1310/34]|nr:unnamed protein product [Ectocarpus sp. CCAP 1310/34]